MQTQLLVEPLTRISDYKCLVGTLNEILQQHQLQQQQQQQQLVGFNGPNEPQRIDDKENHVYFGASRIVDSASNHFMLMNKRQLVDALNGLFLSQLKSNLVERCHEFTDCPYTSHEHRENIVLLLHCIKLQLNKLVKHIYRLVSQPI